MEGNGRKVKMTHVLETFLEEKGKKRKENKGRFPSKTFLPNVGGNGRKGKEM